MKEILHRLAKIQQDLKAPKGQTNSFGNYKYRSCEDILEAVKPILGEGVALTISDEMVQLGDRYYVKATATLRCENDEISNSAYARESLDKKGMDSSQVTGATSSYARKYALNGLFAIDDTKDPDTMDNTSLSNAPKKEDAVVNDELCPKCNSTLVRGTTTTGKDYIKCSKSGWDKVKKEPTGCSFIQWMKPISAEEPDF